MNIPASGEVIEVITESHAMIWNEATANHARLGSCDGPHDFESIGVGLGRARCRKCGGEMGWLEVHSYRQGLEHGRAESRRQAGEGKS